MDQHQEEIREEHPHDTDPKNIWNNTKGPSGDPDPDKDIAGAPYGGNTGVIDTITRDRTLGSQ